MSDPNQNPGHLSDEDIAALLDEAALVGDHIAEGQENALDLGALEALVFEGETNLLPRTASEETSPGSSTAGDEVANSGEPTDMPHLNSLNILFGFDQGEDAV